jgi:hypothetical protein
MINEMSREIIRGRWLSLRRHQRSFSREVTWKHRLEE